MDGNMKTRAVKNKDVCTKLINMGFELLNVTPNRDDRTKSCFIFEDTEEFAKAFQEILDSRKMQYGKDELNAFERSFIVGILVQKRDEYKRMGIQNVDTLDGCISKLKGSRGDKGDIDGAVMENFKVPYDSDIAKEIREKLGDVNLSELVKMNQQPYIRPLGY